MRIDSRIRIVRNRIGFDRFELDLSSLSRDQRDVMRKYPKVGAPARVKLHPQAKSSAYGQMWEYVLVAGYMQGDQGVKALVIFTEREDDQGELDFAFVDVNQIKEYKTERVHEVRLTR